MTDYFEVRLIATNLTFLNPSICLIYSAVEIFLFLSIVINLCFRF